ncbi:MAG: hypothetical protein IPM52_07255 [Bacteroidetes bacterium]|nr:hypothetical protein [Bacteroidota bacterium]
MKLIKNRGAAIYWVAALFLSLLLTACALDEDIGPDVDPIEKYLGIWSVSDHELKVNYTVSIQRNPSNSTEVRIQNFAASGGAATALVVGNTLTITSPVIGNGWQVSGTGVYKNASRIEFTYSLVVSGASENRFALFTR